MAVYTSVRRYCMCRQYSCMLVEKSRPDAMVLRTVSAWPLSRPMTISNGTPVTAVTSRWNLLRRNGRSSHGASMTCCATSWSLGSVYTWGRCVLGRSIWRRMSMSRSNQLLAWSEGYTGCPKTGRAKLLASWKSSRYWWGSSLAATLGRKVHTMWAVVFQASA